GAGVTATCTKTTCPKRKPIPLANHRGARHVVAPQDPRIIASLRNCRVIVLVLMNPLASSTHLIWAAVALAAFSAGYYLTGNSEPQSGKAGRERGTGEFSAASTADATHLSHARSLAGESKQGTQLTPEQIRTRVFQVLAEANR